METTEFKVAMVFITVVLIAIAFELPVRLVKLLFQNPENDKIISLEQDEDAGHPEPQWTEQDFWYPPEIKPFRYGVYKVMIWSPDYNAFGTGSFEPRFCVYSSIGWLVPRETIEGATEAIKKFENQELYWRGVTYD